VLRERFEAIRIEVLAQHVRRDTLRRKWAICATACATSCRVPRQGEFDLKQDPGGTPISSSCAVLGAYLGRTIPPVAMYSDTIRQLESVASADLVPQSRIDILSSAYRDYRTCLHTARSKGKGAIWRRVIRDRARSDRCNLGRVMGS